jgi:hypothetical protein
MSFQHTGNAENINVSAEIIFSCPLLIYLGIQGNVKNGRAVKTQAFSKEKCTLLGPCFLLV